MVRIIIGFVHMDDNGPPLTTWTYRRFKKKIGIYMFVNLQVQLRYGRIWQIRKITGKERNWNRKNMTLCNVHLLLTLAYIYAGLMPRQPWKRSWAGGGGGGGTPILFFSSSTKSWFSFPHKGYRSILVHDQPLLQASERERKQIGKRGGGGVWTSYHTPCVRACMIAHLCSTFGLI